MTSMRCVFLRLARLRLVLLGCVPLVLSCAGARQDARPPSTAEPVARAAEPSEPRQAARTSEQTATSREAQVQTRDGLTVRTVPSAGSELSDGAAVAAADDWSSNPTGEVGVTLARRMVFPPYLWVANHTNQTVSRVSTETGREQGRYWVGMNPSRTAVDLDGNVWIGGRDDGRLTKILWDTTECPDRNGDGVVQTATAQNLGPLGSAERPLADECVAYSAVPTPEHRSIRGIAAGPDGRVWFGYTRGGVRSIHAQTFELGPHVQPSAVPLFRRDDSGRYRPTLDAQGEPATVPGSGIYGLVVDREGFLYASPMNRQTLMRFNTYAQRWDAVYEQTGCSNYGIAIDGSDHVWLGCTDGGVMSFDPAGLTTRRFRVPSEAPATGGTSSRALLGSAGASKPRYGVTGLGVEPATGDVWASFWQLGITGRLHLGGPDDSESTWSFISTSGGDLRGVGFDHEGFAWTHGVSSDRIWKIDPRRGALAEGFEQGVPIGRGPHYTYSDFTGSTGLSFTSPRGVWSFEVPAPDASSPLQTIRWAAYVPPRALAELRLRPMYEDGRPPGPWVPAPSEAGVASFRPFDQGARVSTIDVSALGLRAARFQVEVRLSTSGDERPIVSSVELGWQGGD